MQKKIQIVLLSIVTAIALSINLDIPNVQDSAISSGLLYSIYKLLNIISQDLTNSGFFISILTAAFFYIYYTVYVKKELQTIKGGNLLALVFSLLYAGGRVYAYGNTLAVALSLFRGLKVLILIIGYYGIFRLAITIAYFLLNRKQDISYPKKIQSYENKHPFLFYWFPIIGIWVLHLLLRFPGLMSYDNRNELAYYYGYLPFSNIQPPFHTWLFGNVVELGRLLGQPNLGLFLFVLLQTVILSLILAYSLYLMKSFRTPVWLRLLTLGIYCTASYYIGYVAFPVKDMLYISFFMLMLLILIQFVHSSDALEEKRSQRILLMIAGIMMILFRSNGIFVYLPVAFVVTLLLLKKNHWRLKKQTLLFMVSCIVLPIVLSTGIRLGIEKAYHAEPSSSQEVFSITYQQIARYVRDYGEDVSPEDKAAISRVLQYDVLAERYNELTVDPVKSTFNWDATSEDIGNYLGAWFHCFLKHPLCYIEATWNQNYSLFVPDIDNKIFNRNCYVGEDAVVETGMNDFIRFEMPGFSGRISDIMYDFYAILLDFPILGLFSNVAFYCYVLFTVLLFIRRDKVKNTFPVILPILLSFIMILLSPQILQQPRYAFPIIYAMPSLVGLYVGLKRGRG